MKIKKITVGFTGTQAGMTEAQKLKFIELIQTLQPAEFHHGDCVGSDAQAHDMVKELFPGCTIVIHPPTKSDKRAFKKGTIMLDEKPYLTRNKHIVDLSEYLIATPATDKEVLRSGTWSTVRYGKKQDRHLFVILPNGMYMT